MANVVKRRKEKERKGREERVTDGAPCSCYPKITTIRDAFVVSRRYEHLD